MESVSTFDVSYRIATIVTIIDKKYVKVILSRSDRSDCHLD